MNGPRVQDSRWDIALHWIPWKDPISLTQVILFQKKNEVLYKYEHKAAITFGTHSIYGNSLYM